MNGYKNENKMAPQKHPNMIWVFADQLRAQALGCNGDPNVFTPNLDMLSQTGIQVEGAVSGMPLCCPFRGSLLSGLYPHHAVPGHECRLPKELPTVADAFGGQGYETAYFGKWHLDGLKDGDGTCENYVVPRDRRGHFDTWMGYENNNSPFHTWVHGHRRHKGGEEEIGPTYLAGYETDRLTGLLCDWLREGRNQPFFAVLSVQPPHDPHFAPPKDMGRHTPGAVRLRPNVPPVPRIEERARRHIAGYYAQIENLDQNVGLLLDVLEETGLADNTHIVFFSDHGEMMGSHGHFRKMSPYQESVRIPVIFSGGRRTALKPGLKGGYREKICFNHVDFAPTSLGLCGLSVPEWMEGMDYSWMRIAGRERTQKAPNSAYLQSVIPTGHFDSVDKPFRGVVTEDGWKYVCLENCEWMLFHLEEDPYELANYAHERLYEKERRKLYDLLQGWIEKTGDSFLLPQRP